MFSFLWGGGGKPQDADIDEEVDQYDEDPSLSQPSPSPPPQPHPTHHPHPHSDYTDPSQAPHDLTAEEFYNQQYDEQPVYDDPQSYHEPHYPDQSHPSSAQGQAEEEEEGNEVDPSQFDVSMIPLLRATLKRKDEQLIALEEQHDRDIQQLRLKYRALLASPTSSPASSNPASPHTRASSGGRSPASDAAVIHSHPDYLSLHEQYSRLFEEYNHMQEAYAAMERGQGEVMGSLKEEVEYEVRQSLHAQFEEVRRRMEQEREEEAARWREEEEGWRRQLEALQVQLQTNGLHQPHSINDSRDDLTRALRDKEEEVASLHHQLHSLKASIENERLQMSEEQTTAMERADAQAEEIERLQAQLQQQQPAEIQLYSNEEWDQLHAECDRLRQRVAELEQAAGSGAGAEQASHSEYQQHIAALEAHIAQQAQQLQMQATAAVNADNSGEVEALRSQVLHLTAELAKKEGELQTVHRTVGQKLEQVRQVIKKKDAEIARLQQKLTGNSK